MLCLCVPACIFVVHPLLLHDPEAEAVVGAPVPPAGTTQGPKVNVFPFTGYVSSVRKCQGYWYSDLGLDPTATKGIAAAGGTLVEEARGYERVLYTALISQLN